MIADTLGWITGPGWGEFFSSSEVRKDYPSAAAYRARHETDAFRDLKKALKRTGG